MSDSRFYVYVAGPLSDYPGQYLANVARLSLASRQLMLDGYCPINPAADLLEGILGVSAMTLGAYQGRGLNLMRLLVGQQGCVYVTALRHADGRRSSGVAMEVLVAEDLGIPVFYGRAAVDGWRWALEVAR